ncbi:unnamed protein product [Psylliodes chrysocephalus]|uniref:Uncharacterized protein n=1 Tax=Psylliodes chrysocephalus TaxID=3402493 RepID=A0A9P0DG47_9CUCU|nr:unnamed protein product [Psylliodes chrysocephala]
MPLVAQFFVSPFMEIDIQQFATCVMQNFGEDIGARKMEVIEFQNDLALKSAAKSRWGHELYDLNNDEIVVNSNPYNVPVDTNILNEDILLDLEIEEELPNKTFTLEGKRIINIGYFFEQLQNIQHLPSFACSLVNCQIINEVTNASKFIVKCNMCNEKFSLNSQQADELYVNLAAVLGKYITQSYVKLAIVTCYTIAVSP